MQIDVLTLFPEMFESPLQTSILGKAQKNELISINLVNIRDFAEDKHHIVDDTPYGGGAGMVFKPDVVVRCIENVQQRYLDDGPVIYLSPQGKPFTQEKARQLASYKRFTLLCGHYEDIDERVRAHWVDEELSIGDYVLTGGEIPAMVVIDAVCRLIPGVLGAPDSADHDSFENDLLDYPHYTRPAEFCGLGVPDVLLSGHHEKIRRWRLKESLRNTLLKRPDLLDRKELNAEERNILRELLDEQGFERR